VSTDIIDQYIRELKAIRDYPTKCQELNEAWALTSHLQKELNEKEIIISLSMDRIKEQNFTITNLENALREAREEVSNLRKGVGTVGGADPR
jgi:predicted nuclease with TOPRIM domain